MCAFINKWIDNTVELNNSCDKRSMPWWLAMPIHTELTFVHVEIAGNQQIKIFIAKFAIYLI